MLPHDILRLILLKATEDEDWYLSLPCALINFYKTCDEFKEFLTSDKLFWKILFSRMGLKIRESVEDYFSYFVMGEWIERINYRGCDLLIWGGLTFLGEMDTYRVYPLNLLIKKSHLSTDKEYLAVLEDDKISIYHKEFSEQNKKYTIQDEGIISLYIKDTVIGLILGILYPTRRSVMILGEHLSVSYLEPLPSKWIYTYGYFSGRNYHRFDNSPLRKWEEGLFSRMHSIAHPFDSSKVIFSWDNREISYIDADTGEETEGVLVNRVSYNEDRTKIIYVI